MTFYHLRPSLWNFNSQSVWSSTSGKVQFSFEPLKFLKQKFENGLRNTFSTSGAIRNIIVNCSKMYNKEWKEIGKLRETFCEFYNSSNSWIIIREVSHKLLNFAYSVPLSCKIYDNSDERNNVNIILLFNYIFIIRIFAFSIIYLHPVFSCSAKFI